MLCWKTETSNKYASNESQSEIFGHKSIYNQVFTATREDEPLNSEPD